ncbi:MAG TPA: hypothetical protein VLS89_20465, partial [Candidatus Nanopelagicales bacterium]|nr:hypothetical protein [Candidatus Nanopelagicales bacterium]
EEAVGCSATGVLLDGISTSLFAPSRLGAPGEAARLVAPLPMREGRARSLVLVLTCAGDDYVSDVAQFDGPP